MMLGKELRDPTANAGLEEIGFRFLVLDQVNTFATQIVSFVEAPRSVCTTPTQRRLDKHC